MTAASLVSLVSLVSLACPMWCALLAAQPAQPAQSPQSPQPPSTPTPTPDIAAELSRLEGHEVAVAADGAGYRIVSVAGEGAPLVGVVERHGRALHLAVESGACLRLVGPLARPRIAGPRYKIWVLGEVLGDRLHARRLGVLSPPRRSSGAHAPRCRPAQ